MNDVLFEWLAVGLSLIGASLNANRRVEGFVVWIAADIMLFALDLEKQLYGEALMFIVYILICIRGIRVWREWG